LPAGRRGKTDPSLLQKLVPKPAFPVFCNGNSQKYLLKGFASKLLGLTFAVPKSSLRIICLGVVPMKADNVITKKLLQWQKKSQDL
jgi:hypothetical protein